MFPIAPSQMKGHNVGHNFAGVPPQSSTNTKLSSCFEYKGLMIVSKYFVGGGLWRLLNINLFITSARPLKSIFSLF
jgi:hypothetical protein